MLPLKAWKQMSFEEGNLSFLNSSSTRAESFPLLCKQALSPSTISCPRLWTTQRENHLWTTEKRQVLKHLQGLLQYIIYNITWLWLLSDFMVTTGQGSQAGISVLCSVVLPLQNSCGRQVPKHHIQFPSIKKKCHSSELNWEKSLSPWHPPRIPSALTAKGSGKRTKLFFSRCSARKNSQVKKLFLFTDNC